MLGPGGGSYLAARSAGGRTREYDAMRPVAFLGALWRSRGIDRADRADGLFRSASEVRLGIAIDASSPVSCTRVDYCSLNSSSCMSINASSRRTAIRPFTDSMLASLP